MATKKVKKEFTCTWIFEPFDGDESFFEKRMFGGLAAYYKGRMVMVLVESPGEKTYRQKRYDCDLWNGVLLPTEKDFQPSLMKDFKGLKAHLVLGKWLYLPAVYSDFETRARDLALCIANEDERLGIEPKMKGG